MPDFHSNEEFFDALRGLIDRWCEERRLAPLARLLPSYLAFNGMTDGWGELRKALGLLRALGPESFTSADWTTIADLLRAMDAASGTPSNSN